MAVPSESLHALRPPVDSIRKVLETDAGAGNEVGLAVAGILANGKEGSFSRPAAEILGEEAIQYDADGKKVDFVVLNDEVLTSVANATIVLINGSDLEKLAVLYQFPQFLEHCPQDTIKTMVTEICRNASSWKQEVQMAAAEALYFIVDMKIDLGVAGKIVFAALEIVKSSNLGEVFDAWGEILCHMIPRIERRYVLDLVVPATVERAQAKAVDSRRLAARIIGSLCDSLTPSEVESLFLTHALKLCTDSDEGVRAMIAQSLSGVASKLSLRVVEQNVWGALVKLTGDENARVRAAAMRAIAKSAEAHKSRALTSKSYKQVLLPLFKEECKRATMVASKDLREVDDDTYLMLEIFSEVYGYFLCAVSPLFQDEDTWTIALNGLRRMVTCNGPTVRHWCAYNLPAVASVTGGKRPHKMKGVVRALSTDTDVETRATLAAGIHETTSLLAEGPLREELVSAVAEVMTDQNPQVRMNALTHFDKLLEVLSRSATNQTEMGDSGGKSAARDLKSVFMGMDMMLHDSWRTQELLCSQLDRVMHLIPQDLLCEVIAPLLFQLARESTYLVRKSAMSALIRILRVIPDIRRRDHIMKHMRSEWARGKVYWTRLAFIEGSYVAMSLFSRRLFTQLFASDLLNLCNDAIPNVRLKLAQIIPDLVRICGGNKPEVAMEALLGDEDADVAAEALRSKKRIKRLKPLSPQEEKLDKEKESAEKALYVHRKRRSGNIRRVKRPAAERNEVPGSGEQQGNTHDEPADGRSGKRSQGTNRKQRQGEIGHDAQKEKGKTHENSDVGVLESAFVDGKKENDLGSINTAGIDGIEDISSFRERHVMKHRISGRKSHGRPKKKQARSSRKKTLCGCFGVFP